MTIEVKIPTVGESVQEGMIHKWHKQTGDWVDVDDVILEVETDKATVEVVAEAAGTIATIKNEGDTVEMGEVVARIDTDAKKPADSAPASAPAPAPSLPPTPAAPSPTPLASVPPPPAAIPLSPAVQRVVAENQLNPADIPASGKGGRLTKGDVIAYMDRGPAPTLAPAPEPNAAPPSDPISDQGAERAPTPAPATIGSGSREERREPMSMLRRRIAQRLLSAQENAAILTTFNEIDMKSFIDLRKQYKERFQEQHGIGLGFMSIFVRAAIEGLKAFPAINGWIEGNEIVYHDYCDIGVAVSSDKGLVVPVLRNAEAMSLAEIERSIAYYAQKARDGKISIEDMTGGTFTISNGGVFGSMMSTPILNPPQSGILGMHKTTPRPVVVGGNIEVRPMMYVALSYDHRIVDGKEAVQFLVKVKECVEDPTRLLLGV